MCTTTPAIDTRPYFLRVHPSVRCVHEKLDQGTMLTLAVQLPLFLWIVLGSADIEKLRQTPSDLYSLQAVSNINNWLQVAQ